ncbi:unnamed protein product [Brachionus calyciflorus]|uniref:Nuclear receptor domain-containing protein n=1 Tax=Brachionus calyciflorus TaxID=104777 RepID=A0A814GAG3_9BILA|nr:unnamed protein product [Brachionus calyciflorus]
MSNQQTSKNNRKELSEKEFIDAVSLELYLNKKRIEKDPFEAKYNFGNCKICNDKATGIHFGICSCEGCKGFFRRSISRNKNYKCRKNTEDCEIYPKQRKKCKLCRWNACINAGMSLNCIRMGRIPNSMKQIQPKLSVNNIENRVNKTTENSLISLKHLIKLNKLDRNKSIDEKSFIPNTFFSEQYLNKSNENQLIVLSLLRDKSYQIYREQTLKFECHEMRALKLLELGNYEAPRKIYDEETINKLRQLDMDFLKNHVSSMFLILSELPGFQRVKEHDLNTMINGNFFSVLTLRTFRLFLNGDYFLMLDQNTQLNKEAFGIVAGEKVRDYIFEYIFNLKSLNLTPQEIGLLIPFYFSIFNENLEEPDLIREINEYYTRALYYEFNLNHRSTEFMEKFVKVIRSAPTVNRMCLEIEVKKSV